MFLLMSIQKLTLQLEQSAGLRALLPMGKTAFCVTLEWKLQLLLSIQHFYYSFFDTFHSIYDYSYYNLITAISFTFSFLSHTQADTQTSLIIANSLCPHLNPLHSVLLLNDSLQMLFCHRNCH